MIIKPISIAAYVLTVVTVIFLLASFIPPRWCVIYKPNMDGQRWHGLWSQQKCDDSGACSTIATGFEIEGGREFFFICKIFHLLALVLAALGLLLHTVYIGVRKARVRQVVIYTLGAAGLFLLLSTILFVALFGRLRDYGSQVVDLGPCFPLSLLAAILALVASALTAWASVRKANYADDDMEQAPVISKNEQ